MPGPIHGFQKRRRLNVQNRLLRDLALLIAVTAGAILLLGLFTATSVKRQVSASRIKDASNTALLEYERASSAVDRILLIARGWGREGMLDPADAAEVDRLLIPVLEALPQVAGISVASSKGDSYFLMHDGDGWLSRSRGPDPDGPFEVSHWTADKRRITDPAKTLDYDPRERLWYRGALETPGKIYDSPHYTFYTSQLPGITSAISWTEEGSPDIQWVVGADFLLRDIGRIISEIRVGTRGRVFLIGKDGMVFQPPSRGSGESGSIDYFVAPERLADPVLTAAIEKWRSSKPLHAAGFRFKAEDAKFWAGFQRLESGEEAIWLGVIVAEVDFLGAALHSRRDLLFVGILILAGAIGLVAVLVRKYRHQLRDLPYQQLSSKTFEQDVLDLIREGESDTLEFKSTVRMNLATGKPGKEIEVAWLKSVVGFMNTDGGTILIGVNDAGEPVGIESDEFANEDKCRLHLKNLVNEHVGAEFTPFVQFQVGTVRGRMIVAIECERCPRPVFLHARGKESFYIRSGPSAVELTPSEVLNYVRQRS